MEPEVTQHEVQGQSVAVLEGEHNQPTAYARGPVFPIGPTFTIRDGAEKIVVGMGLGGPSAPGRDHVVRLDEQLRAKESEIEGLDSAQAKARYEQAQALTVQTSAKDSASRRAAAARRVEAESQIGTLGMAIERTQQEARTLRGLISELRAQRKTARDEVLAREGRIFAALNQLEGRRAKEQAAIEALSAQVERDEAELQAAKGQEGDEAQKRGGRFAYAQGKARQFRAEHESALASVEQDIAHLEGLLKNEIEPMLEALSDGE